VMSDSKFWLNRAIDQIEEAHPEGEIILESGFGPSGIFHLGHLREVLTVDALRWGLQQRDRDAKHILFIDDFDALRKVPANVDSSFEKYLGMPVYLVPSPDGSDKNYAEYFFDEFAEAIKAQRVEAEILWAHEEYQSGKFTDHITMTLQNNDKIHSIIEDVSHRQLKREWVPIQILSDDNKLDNWTFKSYDADDHTVEYIDDNGQVGKLSYADGRVKLNWRIDWPARWAIWGVQVEPFGRDHATKGGSFDTGKAIIEEIFKTPAPLPYPYEFVNLKGETKKMSASSGTGLIPNDMLEVMPPEVLRYMFLKNRPGLTIYVDTGQDFGKLFDEFAEVEHAVLAGKDHEHKQLYQLAMNGQSGPTIVNIPFNHLVASWQAGRKNIDHTLEILARTDHDESLNHEILESELKFVDVWLEKWAPADLRFEIQEHPPEIDLSEAQIAFVGDLAGRIESATKEIDGEWMHHQIYEAKEEHSLEPKQAFSAIYHLILNQDSGPRAGWFLSTLEKDWLIKRFRCQS